MYLENISHARNNGLTENKCKTIKKTIKINKIIFVVYYVMEKH